MLTPSELRESAKRMLERFGNGEPNNLLVFAVAELCEQVADLRESQVPDFIIAECSGREYRIPNPKKHKPPQPRILKASELECGATYAFRPDWGGKWQGIIVHTSDARYIPSREFYGPIPLPE